RRLQPQTRLVFAQTTTLHVQRDHVDGGRGGDAIVDSGQQKRLSPAARRARRTNGVAFDVAQRLQKIQRSDAVPELESGKTQSPQLFAIATKRMRQLPAVVVADH